MVEEAQKWLEENYPKKGICQEKFGENFNKNRVEIKKIILNNRRLINSLFIKDWPQLEEIYCGWNQLASLILDNCPNLKKVSAGNNQLASLAINNCREIRELSVNNNQLTNLDFLTNLSTEKVIHLDISNNNFSAQDLSAFSQFINCEILYINNNPFFGSLSPLQSLGKLRELDIINSNLAGLEYLPESLEYFYCDETKLVEELKDYNGNYLTWRKEFYNPKSIELLKKENARLFSLENEVEHLTNLIKAQKTKIIEAYTHFFSEKELLQQLIASHLEYKRTQEQNLPSVKLRKERDKVRDKLEEVVSEDIMEEVEIILKDCEKLIHWETELQYQITNNQRLIAGHQQTINQITYNITNAYVSNNEANPLNLFLSKELLESIPENPQLKISEEKEVAIVKAIADYLEVKQQFLTARQTTIRKLQDIYNKLVNSNNKKHANIDAFGNVLNEIGGIPVTLGVPKIVGNIIKIGNGIFKQTFADKNSKTFLNLLEEEEEQLPQINDAYECLIHLIRSNQDLREFDLVKTLNLVDKVHLQESKLFNPNYEVFDVDKSIWPGKPLTSEEMKETIKLLGENLQELKSELAEEQKQLRIWEEQKLVAQIEVLSN